MGLLSPFLPETLRLEWAIVVGVGGLEPELVLGAKSPIRSLAFLPIGTHMSYRRCRFKSAPLPCGSILYTQSFCYWNLLVCLPMVCLKVLGLPSLKTTS